jgi:hypothetical protein
MAKDYYMIEIEAKGTGKKEGEVEAKGIQFSDTVSAWTCFIGFAIAVKNAWLPINIIPARVRVELRKNENVLTRLSGEVVSEGGCGTAHVVGKPVFIRDRMQR